MEYVFLIHSPIHVINTHVCIFTNRRADYICANDLMTLGGYPVPLKTLWDTRQPHSKQPEKQKKQTFLEDQLVKDSGTTIMFAAGAAPLQQVPLQARQSHNTEEAWHSLKWRKANWNSGPTLST